MRGEYKQHRIRIRWKDPDNTSVKPESTILQPDDNREERLLERVISRTELLTGFKNLPAATMRVIDCLASKMLETLLEIKKED